MTIVNDTYLPPCADSPESYLDENLDASAAALSAAEREKVAATKAAIHRQCAACPLLVDCLYRAVVEVDVSGYAACTTESERARSSHGPSRGCPARTPTCRSAPACRGPWSRATRRPGWTRS